MSLLSTVEERLPPGFRFHPRDDELICDYLAPKLGGGDGNSNGGFVVCPMLVDVDLNKCEPWDLPEMALVGGKEWYFFSLKDRKYATGQRTNRATLSGYWKATGKDKPVVRRAMLVGMRKTLVFYQGRAPKGKKTEWVMHEFRMEGHGATPKSNLKEDWVLCRVFYKSRGMSDKPNSETSSDDTVSSSLPPLTDSYTTFNQTLQNQECFEQVPCFSSFTKEHVSQLQDATIAPNLLTMERSLPNKNLPNLGGCFPYMSPCLNPLSSDKKGVATLLDHLNRLEAYQRREAPNFARETSESYISEIEPSVWHPF